MQLPRSGPLDARFAFLKKKNFPTSLSLLSMPPTPPPLPTLPSVAAVLPNRCPRPPPSPYPCPRLHLQPRSHPPTLVCVANDLCCAQARHAIAIPPHRAHARMGVADEQGLRQRERGWGCGDEQGSRGAVARAGSRRGTAAQAGLRGGLATRAKARQQG